jgi:hypothetical protein
MYSFKSRPGNDTTHSRWKSLARRKLVAFPHQLVSVKVSTRGASSLSCSTPSATQKWHVRLLEALPRQAGVCQIHDIFSTLVQGKLKWHEDVGVPLAETATTPSLKAVAAMLQYELP